MQKYFKLDLVCQSQTATWRGVGDLLHAEILEKLEM